MIVGSQEEYEMLMSAKKESTPEVVEEKKTEIDK